MSAQTMYRKPRNPKAPTSARQGDYIRTLAARLNESIEVPATMDVASALIEMLKDRIENEKADAAEARAALPPVAPLEAGMYEAEGKVYRVQASRNTGRLYAKALTFHGHGKASFEYAPGAIFRLTADHRMSLADVAARGLAAGVCCVCGRSLTVEKSVAAGIGPVCAKRV